MYRGSTFENCFALRRFIDDKKWIIVNQLRSVPRKALPARTNFFIINCTDFISEFDSETRAELYLKKKIIVVTVGAERRIHKLPV